MDNNLLFTQLLVQRLGHDLASPMSVLINCIELIENDNDEIRAQARRLFFSEANVLNLKFKLFNFIFGFVREGSASAINFLEIKKMIESFIDQKQISFTSSVQDSSEVQSHVAQIIICIVLIATDNIMQTGELHLGVSGQDSFSIKATKSDSKKFIIKDDKIALLRYSDSEQISVDMSVDNIREYYVRSLCQSTGVKIIVQRHDDNIEYHVKL